MLTDIVDRISDLNLEEFELCSEMNHVTESTRKLKDGQSFTCEIVCLHRKIENNIYHSAPRGICRRQNYTLYDTELGKRRKYSGNLICVCEVAQPLRFKFSIQQTIQVGTKVYYVYDAGVQFDHSDRKHFARVKEYELENVYGDIKAKFIQYFAEFARRHKPISWPSVVNHILKLHCYYDGYTKEYVSLATIVLQYFKDTVDDVSHFLEPEQIRKNALNFKVKGNSIA